MSSKVLELLSDEEYNRFYEALKFSLKWEGGYVNDPADPGGETKWGISKRAYPKEDIKNLTPERAAELYFRDYWRPSGAFSVGPPDCTVVFDTAVHCGVGRASKWLRESKEDVTEILEARRRHYTELAKKNPSLQKFLKGWLNRLADLEKYVEVERAA